MKLLILSGLVAGVSVNVLVDSGARRDVLSDKVQKKIGLKTTPIRLGVVYSNRARSTLTRQCRAVPLCLGKLCLQRDFVVAPIPFDIILGKAWLEEFNPRIDWVANTVDLVHGDESFHLVCS